MPFGEGQLIDETGIRTGGWYGVWLLTGTADIIRKDGKRYKGEVVNDMMDGRGILYEEEGSFYYEGSFSENKF